MSAALEVVALVGSGITAERWDAFVERAEGGSIFHRLGFLAYHGTKFAGRERHLAILRGGQLFGVLPMAISDEDGRCVARSPYGGSYGGPIFERRLRYAEAMGVADALVAALRDLGADELLLTLPIATLYREPCETLRLALCEHGFESVRRDISSVAVVQPTRAAAEAAIDPRALRAARKARNLGVTAIRGADLDAFWPVLVASQARHGATPTHTRDELAWLAAAYPDAVSFDLALLDGQPIAGIGHLAPSPRVDCTFYLATDPAHRDAQGLALLAVDLLTTAADRGFAHVDFGTSSVDMHGRSGVFEFKEQFGTVGVARETLRWRAEP
jgi:hypothetical protein